MSESHEIEIAIIDSGINAAHSHVGVVAGGVSFERDSDGNVVPGEDFSDLIGHGTAIAGVIREKNPAARLYAVRIFDGELAASSSLLIAALGWAVEEGIGIIHMSLGVESEAAGERLAELCRRAYEKDIIMIASARSRDDAIYPASLETVIGVCQNENCGEDSLIYYPESPVDFGACGLPRALPGLSREMNFRGNSFAAARVTARAASLLAENPGGGASWVRERLVEEAQMAEGI
jgi:subtilisin family serine protease